MNNQLREEIIESIRRNLPSQVSDELSAFIDEAKVLKKERPELLECKKKLKAYSDREDELIQRENTLDIGIKTLQAEKDELEQQKLKLHKSRLEYELEAEKKKTEFAMNVCNNLVRNTEYRKILTPGSAATLPIVGTDQYGNNIYGNYDPETLDETNTAE